jgi:Flp pilus assembly protein CpaB
MRIRIIGAILALVLAVAGTIAVVLYVRDADRRAAEGAELVPVYVVSDTIPQGTPAERLRDLVTLSRYARSAVHPDAVSSLGELAGQVSTITLLPGDQLVASRFADPADLAAQGNVVVPDGMQEVTIALPVEQVVGGAVRGGDRVGLVVSTVDAEGGAVSRFVFHKVLVTRTQAGDNFVPDPSAQDAAPVATIMVTLALTTPDIERVVWAAEQQQNDRGGIWLTLEPEGADESGSRLVTGEVAFE